MDTVGIKNERKNQSSVELFSLKLVFKIQGTGTRTYEGGMEAILLM